MPKKKHSLEFEKPLLELEKQLDEILQSSQDTDLDFSQEIKAIEKKIELTKKKFTPILHPGKKFSFQGIQIALFL